MRQRKAQYPILALFATDQMNMLSDLCLVIVSFASVQEIGE